MTDDRSQVYRRVVERYADACVIQRRYFSGCSVLVWGGVKERGRTPLVVDAGYLTEGAMLFRSSKLKPTT